MAISAMVFFKTRVRRRGDPFMISSLIDNARSLSLLRLLCERVECKNMPGPLFNLVTPLATWQSTLFRAQQQLPAGATFRFLNESVL